MTTLVMIHGNPAMQAKLQAAMPGATVVVIHVPGLSSGYDEHTGLASKYPTLRGFLAQYAPAWRPGEPLVVVAFSAGGWALRYYLRDSSARQDVTAAVFLDSLYGHVGSQCDVSVYQGVIAYGNMANNDPSAHRLVMTCSQGSPDPCRCVQAVSDATGIGLGVFTQVAANADHEEQQYTVGPEVISKWVTPWLTGSDVSSYESPGAGGSNALLAVFGVLAFLGTVAVGWSRGWFRR